MKLKPIHWKRLGFSQYANVLGYTISVYQHQGKWNCNLSNGTSRPEIHSGFETPQQAEKRVIQLLENHIKNYIET